MVLFALKLLFGVRELTVEAVDKRPVVVPDIDHALVHDLTQEEEQIDERDLVLVQCFKVVEVGVACGVVGKQRRGARLVKPRKARKLVDADLIAETVAVHDLDPGKTERGFDVFKLRYLVEHLRLGVVVARRDDEHHEIFLAEALGYLLPLLLCLVQVDGQAVVVVI